MPNPLTRVLQLGDPVEHVIAAPEPPGLPRIDGGAAG
jgi:hypothetical protein